MKIVEISDLDLAFGVIANQILPKYENIPDKFKRGNTKWNRLFNDWFFSGLTELKLVPKDGVDKNKALRMIKCCMGSFEPKHEHKEAGVAYMLSGFFKDCSYKKKK